MTNIPYGLRDLKIALACLESGVDGTADMAVYLEVDKNTRGGDTGEEFFKDASAEGNTPIDIIQKAESVDNDGVIGQTRRRLQEKGKKLGLERPVESFMENLQRVYTDPEYREKILSFYTTEILPKTASYAGFSTRELEERISATFKKMQKSEGDTFKGSFEG